MVCRILFVCHGNICRSPMAEFVMKDLVKRGGLQDRFEIASCATSTEELGNDVYPPAKRELERRGIPFSPRRARQMEKEDYGHYDIIAVMDSQNLRNIRPFAGDDPDRKVRLLLSFCGEDRGVADPWYTGDFSKTYDDILRGCGALLDALLRDRSRAHL